PLGTRDLGAVQAAGDVHLDAQRAEAHRVLYRAFHRAAEHDAALQLLRDRFGDQLRVKFRFAHFADVDVRIDAHDRRDFAAQLLDVLALLADHDTRTRGEDGDVGILLRTADRDFRHAGLRELLLQQLAHLEVGNQVQCVLAFAREPLGVPVLGNAEADSDWIDFVTHDQPTSTVICEVRLRMREPRPLARACMRFMTAPSSTKMRAIFNSSTSAPTLFSALATADSSTLRTRCAAFLLVCSSTALAVPMGMPRTRSAMSRAFCAEMRAPRRTALA